jgi:H+-transporting ATPase
MAVGAAFLARRKAIVQKLTAIESLAGVDILCTDKTGTLTANQLSVNEREPPFCVPLFQPHSAEARLQRGLSRASSWTG